MQLLDAFSVGNWIVCEVGAVGEDLIDRSLDASFLSSAFRFVIKQQRRPARANIFEARFDLLAELGTIGQQRVFDIVFAHGDEHRGRSPMRGDEHRVSPFDGPEHLGRLGLEFPNVGKFPNMSSR